MDKNSLRKIFLKKRVGLSREQIKQKSAIIQKKVLALDKIESSKTILCYIPINSEVETFDLIKNLKDSNKGIFLPAFYKGFYVLRKLISWDHLEKGPYSIPQPVNTSTIDHKNLDLAILPGVAFDRKGVRLGYGRGVYDKLLAKSGVIKIGLAYDFQIHDKLPRESHDIVVDILVTEKKSYQFI